MTDVHDMEERRLSGLRKEKEDLTKTLLERRGQVRKNKDDDRDVRKFSVMVENLQKTVEEAEAFQDKAASMLRVLKAASPSSMNAFNNEGQDRIVTFKNEALLGRSGLLKENRELKGRLLELKGQLKFYLQRTM